MPPYSLENGPVRRFWTSILPIFKTLIRFGPDIFERHFFVNQIHSPLSDSTSDFGQAAWIAQSIPLGFCGTNTEYKEMADRQRYRCSVHSPHILPATVRFESSR